jgi:hypothetical protein
MDVSAAAVGVPRILDKAIAKVEQRLFYACHWDYSAAWLWLL